MPLRPAQGPKLEILNDLIKKPAQRIQIAQQLRSAPVSLNDPLDTIHVDFGDLRLGLTTIRTELADLRNRLAAVQAEFALYGGRRSSATRSSSAPGGPTALWPRRGILLERVHHGLSHRQTRTQSGAHPGRAPALVSRGNRDRLRHLVLRVATHVSDHVHPDPLIENLLQLVRQGQVLHHEVVEGKP